MSYIARADAMSVATAVPDERAAFIRRTYTHLAGAIAVFAALEVYLLGSPLAGGMLHFISGSRYGWLMILGGFVLIGWMAGGLASGWIQRRSSMPVSPSTRSRKL